MSFKIEKITEQLELGEGPHWDDRNQVLFFVSIHEQTIHKYDLRTKRHTKTKLGDMVGFIVPVEGTTNQFLVGLGKSFVVIQWDGEESSPAKELRRLAEVDPQHPNNRINDGKCDPKGRLFAGTMERDTDFKKKLGAFYRLDGNGQIEKLCENIGISNGMAWDVQKNSMYYTDSLEYKIRKYDYNMKTGDISNMKYIFDLKANNIEGIPDGTTIDTDGNLWVAIYARSCILKIDPESGKVLQKLEIPAKKVTSATFGGPNLDILFVTSANSGETPQCGCTFMVTGLNVKGHKNVNFKLY